MIWSRLKSKRSIRWIQVFVESTYLLASIDGLARFVGRPRRGCQAEEEIGE